MIRHIILFKTKPDVAESQIRDLFAALSNLRSKIPGIKSFSPGAHFGSQRNQGFTHGFVMVFESAQALKDYGPHPEHQKVRDQLLALTPGNDGDVLAFDYEIGDSKEQ